MPQIGGVIVEWSRQRGFGKVECDGMGTVLFDGSVVTEEDLHPGDPVLVDIAEVGGRKRVVRVQPDARWRTRP
jgi:hypothetical protein